MCCIALAAMAISAGEARAEPCYADDWDDCAERLDRILRFDAAREQRGHPLLGPGLRTKWEDACIDDKDASSCVLLAMARHQAFGGDVDKRGAIGAAWLACEFDPGVCQDVIRALRFGDGIPRDVRAAGSLVDKLEQVKADAVGNDSGGGEAVEHEFGDLLDIHILGDYEHQCDRGRADACVKAAVMIEQGVAGKPDRKKAYSLFWIACDLDRAVCIDIAHAYKTGAKVTRDKKLAKKFRRVALQREGEEGCRYGSTDRCVTNGHAFLNGDHVQRDREYAVALFQEACRAGDADGCAGLADAYWTKPKTGKGRSRAVDLYRDACDDKSAAACWKLGRLYMRGEQVNQDTKRAETLFKRACDLGDQAGCDYVEEKP